jgi:SAM-dependent methyltransferase
MTGFDEYADDYESALGQGLAATGEGSAHFARERVRWLARCLDQLGRAPRRILDFGCGTGGSVVHLLGLGPAVRVVGVDPSPESIAVAAARHRDTAATFHVLPGPGDGAAQDGAAPEPASFETIGGGQGFDLVFTNGVLHHIRPPDRPAVIRRLRAVLVPGGLLCVWENNPLNPGTRLVMSRIPFDRDAVPLSARQTRRLLASTGLEPLSTHYLFIFPRALRALRPMEPALAGLPLGGQYQVLARVPADRS